MMLDVCFHPAVSFLGSMCRCAVPCQSEDTDARNHMALPAVKLSLDWLCLQSALADDAAVQDNVLYVVRPDWIVSMRFI